MTSVVDSNLERRISEHLDGELDDAQQAELFRALLRDPEARALMDRYAEQDRLAASALRAAIVAPPRGVDRMKLQPQRRGVPWGQLAATAAVLAMAVGLWFVVNRSVAPDGNSPAGPGHIAQDEPPQTPRANDADSPDGDEASDAARAGATASAAAAGGSAVERITGDLDDMSMALALTAASADGGDGRWWREGSVGPIEAGRLIDDATTGPAIEGYQQRRQRDEETVIGVIDLTTSRMYWLKMQRSTTASDATDREL